MALRRLGAILRAGLYRPLAPDDDRAEYWLRHIRTGVLLTEVSTVVGLGYALLAPTPMQHHPLILVAGVLVLVSTPAMLLLPLRSMLRDHRGPLLLYGWSVLATVVVTVVTRLDGGASSPLFSLLFLTLAFSSVAYPPLGVTAVGALMTGSYLIFVALPDLTSDAVFFAVLMALFTMVCATGSANSWAAHERQALLLRTHEALASTDPLTGCLNRRAFLDRLGRVLDGVGTDRQAVLCLVDLDGFKSVNDRDGHAAGDAILQAVTGALAGRVRDTDVVARLGGDEFAVLADVPSPGGGRALAERLRDAVAAVGSGRGVTASVGAAMLAAGEDVPALLHRADSAMYRAKAAGGDRVAAHFPAVPPWPALAAPPLDPVG